MTADPPEPLTAALDYLARGWSVIPLCPHDHVGVGKAHRGCGSPGKRPFFPNRPDGSQGEWKEFQDRRADADGVRAWWHHHPKLNVGVALGPVSGLVAVDVDDEDGDRLLADLSAGDLPATLEYTTGKGRRLLYRLPEGAHVRSVPFKRPGTEIEILRLMGKGGQVVLPPSVHPNGSTYRWVPGRGPGEVEPADCPAWMRSGAIPESAAPPPGDGELVGQGGRDNYLTAIAGAMRKRGCSEGAIHAALEVMNAERCDPPLADRDLTRIAKSVSRYAPDEWTAVSIKLPEPGVSAGTKETPDPKAAGDVARIADLKRAGAEVKWVWPGWIQRGVLTAVAAEGGTGKTRLTCDLVRRIRHGLPWPDGQPMQIDAGPVVALWVVSDNHHDEMVTLSETFGVDDCVAVNAHPSDPYGGVTLELIEDFVMLEKRIQVVKPVVVVIDTVGNSTDKNLSKQEDAKAYFQPLQVLARRQNVAVLCLTHLNAGGKVLGRRALEKVRTCVRMTAETVNDSSCKRRLEVLKSNSKYPPALGVTMGDKGNEYDDQPPPPPEERETPQTIDARTVECMDWLKEQVKIAPRPLGELRTAAEGKGFSSKTLYAAKGHLRLKESETGNRKWWGLPDGKPNPVTFVPNAVSA